MFKRKAYDKLLTWKSGSGKSALLIEGARRVGKSTLVESFGKKEYAVCVTIDFSVVDPAVKELFVNYRNDLETFFFYLSTFLETQFITRDTLIIFDEVQFFPTARAFIKQLVADGRYDYMETGSLISIKHNVKDILIPSEEDSMRLNPLDYEEFLWALSREQLAEAARRSFNRLEPLPEAIHRELMRLFREYLLVGGMPQAVDAYVTTSSMEAADAEKRRILKLYREDIAKYTNGDEGKVLQIFESIPVYLSKPEKRFILATLDDTARTRSYHNAFYWLGDAFMVNNCYNSTDPHVGLALNAKANTRKCYMADTGLLVSHVFADQEQTPNQVYKDILFGNIGLNEGMLVENMVAQQLISSGHRLFFYSNNDRNDAQQRMEVDFLITRGYENAAMKPRICPIEAKSTTRYGVKSLDKFKAKFGKRVGTQFILHPKPLIKQGDRVYLPLYMAGFL